MKTQPFSQVLAEFEPQKTNNIATKPFSGSLDMLLSVIPFILCLLSNASRQCHLFHALFL